MAEMADMRKRQEKTEESVAELCLDDRMKGHTDANGCCPRSYATNNRGEGAYHCDYVNGVEFVECTRMFSALKNDFDELQSKKKGGLCNNNNDDAPFSPNLT